jgi:type I restriction enzyme S subunit
VSDSALDEIIPLGETGDYINGIGFKESDWNGAGLPIIRIQNLTNEEKPFNFTSREVDEKYHVRNGDILVSWSATLDAFVWRRGPALLNQHIFKVVPRQDSIDPRFLYYQLKSIIYSMSRGEHAHGSTMKHINRKPFLAHPFWRPCLEKQEEIGQWLDAQFSGLDETERTLQAIQAKIKQARASILKAAVEGRLVETDIPWSTKPLRELLAEPMRNGKSAKTSTSGKGVRIATLTAVTANQFTESNTKPADLDPSELDDLWLQPEDIFVQRSNAPELVGSSAMYSGQPNWAIFPDLLIRVRCSPEILPKWMLANLQAPSTRRYFKENAKGSSGSMPKISQSIIAEAVIACPSLKDQEATLEEIERRFTVLDQVEATVNASLRRCGQLRQAMLKSAFGGVKRSRSEAGSSLGLGISLRPPSSAS